MRCSSCGTELRRPGDHCLVCHEGATDAVVVEISEDRTRLTMMDEADTLGETTITTQTEQTDPAREVQQRNYIARIAAEIRRKRPSAVYVTGDRERVRRLRNELAFDVYRLDGEDAVEAYRERIADPPLDIVNRAPEEKLGGRHSTIIGDRQGTRVIRFLAEHPHVKSIIPGPIDGSGSGSRSGFRAKVTRPGMDGNLRVLLHDGSTVQEIRLVTTGRDRHDGERIADQLNDGLREEDLR